jgi:hypothetical protein
VNPDAVDGPASRRKFVFGILFVGASRWPPQIVIRDASVEALPQNIDNCIRTALAEAVVLLHDAFRAVDDTPTAGSALDQCGLRDGGKIVADYLHAGEPGLALEHVVYMVSEPALPISVRAYQCIKKAGQAMSMDRRLWESLDPLRTPADG